MTREEKARLYPALTQFMMCYYMQNFDITYGSFEGALEAFYDREPADLARRLPVDVEEIDRKGLILDIVKPGSRESDFWKGLGGARLVRRHLETIRRRADGSSGR
jgi:hypothetical protein